jgi:hypothetical protein
VFVVRLNLARSPETQNTKRRAAFQARDVPQPRSIFAPPMRQTGG